MSFTHRGRTLSKIAVIGSGQIGPDIALFFTKVFSPFGVRTVVVDVVDEALQRGQAKLSKKVAKGVETGVFTEEQQTAMLEHVEFTKDYDGIGGADFVVEAATEDRDLKGRIFAQVEGLVADDAILASNSSHLEPEVIFQNAKNKARTLVIHYFFPAERNLMVEIVPGEQTDPKIAAWLLSLYEWMGKAPIQVESRYAYRSLAPGESTIFGVVLADGLRVSELEVELLLSDGLRQETPALRDDSAGEILWRIRAEGEGEQQIGVRLGEVTLERPARVGGGPARVATRILRADDFELLAYPAAAPLARDAPARELSLEYALDRGVFGGLSSAAWLFMGATVVIGFALRGPLGVNF